MDYSEWIKNVKKRFWKELEEVAYIRYVCKISTRWFKSNNIEDEAVTVSSPVLYMQEGTYLTVIHL